MAADLKTLVIRASLRPDTLLSDREATLVLPGTREVAAAWLSEQHPWGQVGDQRVYRWQDLVAAMASGATGTPSVGVVEAARRLGVSRSTLDQAVREAPVDLPAAPYAVGAGRARRHWRWRPQGLETWWAAYCAWKMSDRPSPSKATRRGPAVAIVEGTPVDWAKAAGELE